MRYVGFELQMSAHDMEKMEEEKLKAKYPAGAMAAGRSISGHTAFLQKRLAKGVSNLHSHAIFLKY